MSNKTNLAKQCFSENLQLFAPAKSEPEKFNLYRGLYALAEALAAIEKKLDDLEYEVRRRRD